MVYFSGIQPTGKLHIGNYLGAVKNWINLKTDAQKIYCIVDYHSLTDRINKDHEISFSQSTANLTLELAASLIASGVKTHNSLLFVQSQVPYHTELQWILSCIAPQSWLNIMTQYKDKKNNYSSLGLYTYPVLMAADIILYQASHVPVGLDQKQHIELTREYVVRFNSLFNADLIVPEYIESNAPKIMSLRDGSKKMSKSDQSDLTRINLTDSKDQISEKIKKAKTDSINQIYFDLAKRPEISNLLTIYSGFSSKSIKQIEEEYVDKSIHQFKLDLIDIIINELNPIQLRTDELLKDKSEIHDILKSGQQQAELIAYQNLRKIKNYVGLI